MRGGGGGGGERGKERGRESCWCSLSLLPRLPTPSHPIQPHHTTHLQRLPGLAPRKVPQHLQHHRTHRGVVRGSDSAQRRVKVRVHENSVLLSRGGLGAEADEDVGDARVDVGEATEEPGRKVPRRALHLDSVQCREKCELVSQGRERERERERGARRRAGECRRRTR